jgi:hypothetical protein
MVTAGDYVTVGMASGDLCETSVLELPMEPVCKLLDPHSQMAVTVRAI